MGGEKSIGQLLLAAGSVTAEQIDQGLGAQLVGSGRLGSELVELGYCSYDDVARALAGQKGVPAARSKHFERVDADIAALVPRSLARRHRVFPIGVTAGDTQELVLAMRDPDDRAAIDEIGFITGSRVRPAVAPEALLAQYIERFYPGTGEEEDPPAAGAVAPAVDDGQELLDLGEPLDLDARVATSAFAPPAEDAPLDLDAPAALPASAFAPPDDDEPLLDLADGPVPEARPQSGLQQQPEGPPLPEAQPMPVSSPLPAAGGASAAVDYGPSSGSGGLPKAAILGGVVVVLLLGWMVRGACTSGADEVDVGGQVFVAKHVGLQAMFPLGWKYVPDEEYTMNDQGVKARAALFYAGGNADQPDQALLLMTADSGGRLPDSLPDRRFEELIEEIRKFTGVDQGGATMRIASCKVTSIRNPQTGECLGTAHYRGNDWEVVLYIWIEPGGVLVMAGFMNKQPFDQVSGTVLEILHSIQKI